MTFEEAISDPRRPLSMSPRDWMLSVEAELVEEEDLTHGALERISPEDFSNEKKGNCWVKIDIGIDQIIEGCKILDEGLKEANRKDLNPMQRSIVDYIQDIFSSAIVPYMVDIIQKSEEMK